MNFKINESATKLRGGYYTSPQIAHFLLNWVLATKPTQLLEPSCGDGVFIRALAESQPDSLENVVGLEIDPQRR